MARGAPARRWDVFCSVVDNFGDAAIAWRLARELAREHGATVRLWIDRPDVLARLVPRLAPGRRTQRVDGVEVRSSAQVPTRVRPAEAVVEAFGCGLPEAFVARMVGRVPAPHWFVLEYLTAEPWAESVHGVASPHPRLPLARRFWCPGFTVRTGGLLRERELLGRRDAFAADANARAALRRELGVPFDGDGVLQASLFCYPHAPVEPLLEAWSAGAHRVRCFVPESIAGEAVQRWSGDAPDLGRPVQRGNLELHAVPFLPQDRFDELLWACDVNFVRGEDSFVRAQWAARPFVWHIYPQADAAHLAKLDAFLGRYVRSLDAATAATTREFWRAWNGAADAAPLASAWADFAAALPRLANHAHAWSEVIAGLPELGATLVEATRDGL